MNELTTFEFEELSKHEEIIDKGLKTFSDVGKSLIAIRDGKLYREKFDTFENYCEKRWDMSRRHAYRLMDAAGVLENLKCDQLVTFPTTESQARELVNLPPQEQIKVWKQVRKIVWDREGGKCKRCGYSGDNRKLHIHHISSFENKESRAMPDNLVLLCLNCHRWVHSKKNVNQEFIRKEDNSYV